MKNTDRLRNWPREAQQKSRDLGSQLHKKETELKAKERIIAQKDEKIAKLLKEGGETRSLLNTEKQKNLKIKNSLEEVKINDDQIKGRKISECKKCKTKSKQTEVVTVPVDPVPMIDMTNYSVKMSEYIVYDIPKRLTDENIYEIFQSNESWRLLKLSIKKQRKYKTLKVSLNWKLSLEASHEYKCMTIFLKHKSEEIMTRWFQGSWNIQKIKDFTQHKLYKKVVGDVNATKMKAYAKKIHEDYKVICTKVLNLGTETFVEVTFSTNEELKTALDTTLENTWITKDHMKFSQRPPIQSKSSSPRISLEADANVDTGQDKINKTTDENFNNYIEGQVTSEDKMNIDELQAIEEKVEEKPAQFILYKAKFGAINDLQGALRKSIKNYNLIGGRMINFKGEAVKSLIYLEGHFKSEEDRMEALKGKDNWKEFENLNLSIDKTNAIVELNDHVTLKNNEEQELLSSVTKEQEVLKTSQPKSKGKEVLIEERFEFYRVNDNCIQRLEAEKLEDCEPNEYNKRKKNRSDTLY
ncbi:hypothetical protein RclHR1_03680005 [Rhizophagus clarus]|nr:hypothetical protein RclHR1_03680005 [Rhizophagus clarus]GES76423.1 hypothetical protein RCL_jg26300.t2 [Rhizophagus clarus]